MTAKEYLGLDSYCKDKDGNKMSHDDMYTKLVTDMGYEAVKWCLPTPYSKIIKALDDGDEHLNSISLPVWDSCTIRLDAYRNLGINVISLSEKVCILKQCARMMWQKSKEE